jgi:Flp pilus assembly protein TadD
VNLAETFELAWQYQQSGDLRRAEQVYRQVLQAAPGHAQTWYLLGTVCQLQGRRGEAADCYRQALRLRPDHTVAHNNLGVALMQDGRPEEAEACYRQVLRVKPEDPEALTNLGTVLMEQGRPGEAEACYRRVLPLRPDNPELLNGLGCALAAQARPAEAEACFQEVVRLAPDHAEGHRNLAIALLAQGRFERGWVEYEWRWRCPDYPKRALPQPPWDGSPLGGRTILLHAEQGLGDTLHFIRYAPLVKQRGGTVVVACPRPLARLLAGCAGIDRVVGQGEPLPAFDTHAPLLSLPRLFGTTLATVPANVPYLSADANLLRRWAEAVGRDPAFKIGIAWQGNPKQGGDRQRSVPLSHFEALARLEGVRLYSLQKGAGCEHLRAAGFPVVDLAGRLDEATGPFMDTAALMKVLDLVVTCDSAVAHLAGGLGVPAWVALSYAPDWRWLLAREDSPWYPTLRLFRQGRPGAWADVFGRMAEALNERLAARRS